MPVTKRIPPLHHFRQALAPEVELNNPAIPVQAAHHAVQGTRKNTAIIAPRRPPFWAGRWSSFRSTVELAAANELAPMGFGTKGLRTALAERAFGGRPGMD